VNVLVAYLLICIFFVFAAMCGYSGKLKWEPENSGIERRLSESSYYFN